MVYLGFCKTSILLKKGIPWGNRLLILGNQAPILGNWVTHFGNHIPISGDLLLPIFPISGDFGLELKKLKHGESNNISEF